jgi:Putative peptidoglycan binding domain
MPTLKLGDKGDEVKRLQLLLKSVLIPRKEIAVDGDFGSKTEAAVKQFQGGNALTADGIVGRQTWSALGQRWVAFEPPPPVETTQAQRSTTPKNWMVIAEAEIGVSENALPGKHHSRIVEYHQTTQLAGSSYGEKDETPWCSSFVNWVMKEAGHRGTGHASSDKATGSSTGFHVGFYVSSTSKHLRLLGGNQGDSVKYSNFSLAGYDVKAYRLP